MPKINPLPKRLAAATTWVAGGILLLLLAAGAGALSRLFSLPPQSPTTWAGTIDSSRYSDPIFLSNRQAATGTKIFLSTPDGPRTAILPIQARIRREDVPPGATVVVEVDASRLSTSGQVIAMRRGTDWLYRRAALATGQSIARRLNWTAAVATLLGAISTLYGWRRLRAAALNAA